ncbi:MAG: hypothetical protein AB8B52_03875 [Winogradskyella sp.]|uniref:hypothetical protein n=1 Tax=Winogradskyella sp. TaxID=1883156 RepID=UPI00385E4811
MSEDYNKPAFKKLLQKLQEESWQLELLISGFAIFGLFTAIEPVYDSMREAQNNQQLYTSVIYTIGFISCAILIFNLMLHVLLRGLWIGALGLRYVSGDIDYETLNYSPKFTHYLKKKVGSFDKYIGTLENYCSIIFAISFLLIFYVLAITLTIIVIVLIINYVLSNDVLPGWVSKGIGIPIMIFICLGMFITFIDFITLGFLKKKKWISKIYFPIYWVFSFITLSFLYRPLVYNFLDNKFGRRLSLILVPFYLLISVIASFHYENSNYIHANVSSSSIMANSSSYEELLIDNKNFTNDVIIQSKVITDPFLKVFMLYSENIEDRVFYYNPALEPNEDIRGLSTDLVFNDDSYRGKKDSLRQEYLKTINSIYIIKVDSTTYNNEFIFGQNIKKELGFETYVGTKDLTEGKHLLNVNRRSIVEDDTTYWRVARIPFWYYPN